MTGHDDETLGFYSAHAPAYVSARAAHTNPYLPDFLARLAPGARILELGCGSGHDAAAMLAAGFTVDATDGTPEIAAEAARFLSQPVRVMRFEQLDAIAAYDAVWASASLLHVPRAALSDVLARIHAALRPGGWHYASYKGGDTEGRDSLGRYYNYLSRDQVIAAYRAAAPWQIASVVAYRGGGYDGKQGPWLGITVRRS